MVKFQGYVKIPPKRVNFKDYVKLIKQTDNPRLRKELLKEYEKGRTKNLRYQAKKKLKLIRTSPRASQQVGAFASQFQRFVGKPRPIRRTIQRQSFNRINPRLPQRELSIGEKMLIYKPTLVNQRLDPFVEPSGMDKELGTRFRRRLDQSRRTRSLDRLGARFDKPLSQD